MTSIVTHDTAAALYVRLSREDKAGKYAGCDSIKVQTEDGTDAIRAEGWAFDPDRHIFEDDDVSGRKLGHERDGWSDLIAAARRREFSVLVVRDLARLSRYEPTRTMATLSELRDLGVRVWSYKKRGFLPLDGLDAILTFVDAIGNQQYVETIRSNVDAALRKRAAEGRATNLASLGYRIEDQGTNGKRWVIDAEGAATCHRVAGAFIETRSLFGAAKRLNDEGVRTSRGRAWRPTTIRQLLVRPLYRGRYEKGARGDRGPDAVQIIPHPELRIWTPDEEAAIDALLARPAKPWSGTRARRLSTRVVRCGECGGRLIASGATRSKGKDLCCDHYRHKGCRGIGYKKELLVEAAILEAVCGLLTEEFWGRTKAILRDALEAQREADQRDAEIVRLRQEVQRAQRRVDSLTDGIAEAENAAERAPLRAALGAETKRLEGLRGALTRAEATPTADTPAAILEEAERRVDALRATLARGGADAAEAVEAILGDEKFTAVREGETWRLTARASLRGVFASSSNAP